MRELILLSFILATAACTTEIPSSTDPHPTHGGKADEGGYCASDADLIASARNAVIRSDPSTFSTDSFVAPGRVENLDKDLNADGLFDVLVYPGIQLASGDEEIVVMHGDPNTDCISAHALGVFAASTVAFESQGPDAEDGPLNIVATSNGDCEVVTTWYAFDGTKYVAADTTTDRSACD